MGTVGQGSAGWCREEGVQGGLPGPGYTTPRKTPREPDSVTQLRFLPANRVTFWSFWPDSVTFELRNPGKTALARVEESRKDSSCARLPVTSLFSLRAVARHQLILLARVFASQERFLSRVFDSQEGFLSREDRTRPGNEAQRVVRNATSPALILPDSSRARSNFYNF